MVNLKNRHYWVGVTMMALATQGYAKSNEVDCDQIWRQVIGSTELSQPSAKARVMEQQGRGCKDSVLFHVRLANLHIEAKDIERAEEVVKTGLVNAPDSPELEDSLSQLAYIKGDFKKAELIANKVIQKTPTYVPPYLTLAVISLQRQDWQSAVNYQRKAYELTSDPKLLLPLVSALHQLDRHEEAVATAYQALKADPKLIGNRAGINEAIYSLGSLGRFGEAEKLIRQRMKTDPNWKQDAALVQAARRLKIIE